jgi:hypothetical protein
MFFFAAVLPMEHIIFYSSIFILLALHTLLVKNQAKVKMGADYLRRRRIYQNGAIAAFFYFMNYMIVGPAGSDGIFGF